MLPHIAEKFFHDRYGGKRAWIAHLRWKAAWRLGRLDRFRHFCHHRIERIVFICAGNICRSAYAHAKAVDLGISSESCGINVGSAYRADPFATIEAARRSIDLSEHSPKSVFSVEFRDSDLVAAMEPQQAEWLLSRFPTLRVTLLGAWSRSPRPYLQDPYGRSAAYFQVCFRTIDEALEQLSLLVS